MNPYRIPYAPGSDPFALLAQDGNYYIYCSDMKLYRTPNLIDYEPLGKAYEPVEDDWFSGFSSAPECYFFHGKYYLFHTSDWKENPCNEKETGRVGVLVSDTPYGPFVDPFKRPIFDPEYSVIDVHVYEENDHFWLYYSRCAYHHPVGADDIEESWIYGAELKSDFSELLTQPKLMLRPMQEWENHTLATHQRRWKEGPFVLKHGDTYYMTYSSNTFEDYGVGYATAKHPLGPWTKAEENPILAEKPELGLYAPGHNSFAWSKDGKELYIVYHVVTDIETQSVKCDPLLFNPVATNARKLTGYALQHAAGYDFMDAVPCKDKRRKITFEPVHFVDGKMKIEEE